MTVATALHIPRDLQQRLRARKVIPFVGAGVSRAVRHEDTGEPLFPTWKQLLQNAITELTADHKPVDLVRGFFRRCKQI